MVIGISGKKGVGKTTAATYMKNHYGFYVRSFATPLRRISQDIFDISDKDFEVGSKELPYKHYDWTPRDFVLNLGKFIRYHDNEYLINELAKTLESSSQHYVVDDVRLLAEVEMLLQFKAKIIRINRYESLNPYKPGTDTTETELDNYSFDWVIEDCYNVSLTDLRKQVDVVMKDYGIKRKAI